jgi:hypothetical protein
MRQARPTTERYHWAARRKRCRGRTPVKEGNDRRKDHGIPSVAGRDQIRFLVRVCKTSRTDQGDPKLGPLSRRTKFQIAGTLRQRRATSESLTVIFEGDVKQSSGSRFRSARTAPPRRPRQTLRRRHSRARYRPCEFGLAVWLRRGQQGRMRRKCSHTSRR